MPICNGIAVIAGRPAIEHAVLQLCYLGSRAVNALAIVAPPILATGYAAMASDDARTSTSMPTASAIKYV